MKTTTRQTVPVKPTPPPKPSGLFHLLVAKGGPCRPDCPHPAHRR